MCTFYTNKHFFNVHTKKDKCCTVGQHSTTNGERLLVSESAQACIVVTRYDYKIDFLFVMCFAGCFFWCLFAKEKKVLFMYHAFFTFFEMLRAHKPLIQNRSSNHFIRIQSKWKKNEWRRIAPACPSDRTVKGGRKEITAFTTTYN